MRPVSQQRLPAPGPAEPGAPGNGGGGGAPVEPGANGPGNTDVGGGGGGPAAAEPGPVDDNTDDDVLYGVAGDMERAPGGTVEVTAIALATEGVVKEAVEDGTAATTAAAAAAAAAAATAVALSVSEDADV